MDLRFAHGQIDTMNSPNSDPGPRPYVLAETHFMAIQGVTHTTALSSWQATGFHSDRPGNQAGDLETPMMMYMGPEPVLPVGAGDGLAQAFKIPGLGKGKCPAQRQQTQVGDVTGLEVPKSVSPVKGGDHLRGNDPKKSPIMEGPQIADIKDHHGR